MSKSPAYLSVLTLIILAGCPDDIATDAGETTAGSTTAMEGTGDDEIGTTGEPCDDAEQFCGLDGRCWVREPGWTAWALELTSESVQMSLDMGLLLDDPQMVPGGTCWPTNQGSVLCQVVTDCSELAAFPVAEIPVVGDECEFVGAWEDTVTTATDCWGVFGILASLLDNNPG